MGLMITRREGESVWIGEARITAHFPNGRQQVRLHIEAPAEVLIRREELEAPQPASLADRLIAKIQEAERLLQAGDRYAPILEQTRAMIRREEMNQ